MSAIPGCGEYFRITFGSASTPVLNIKHVYMMLHDIKDWKSRLNLGGSDRSQASTDLNPTSKDVFGLFAVLCCSIRSSRIFQTVLTLSIPISMG